MKTNNYIYLYDGSFNHLLNTIANLIKEQIKPLNIQNEITYQNDLFSTALKITNDTTDKLSYKIKKTNPYIYDLILCSYLSAEENKELIIYYFLLNAYKYGAKIIYMRKLKCVSKILEIAKYVHNEAHKMKGFLRFQELKSHFLFALVAPTNDILGFLSNHFQKRLPKEKWIIYDEKRKKMAIYYQNKIYITNIDIKNIKLLFSKDEKEMEQLWITFFETVAIKERKNYRCQRNFMPKKYWHNIIEMRDKIENNN